MRVLIVDDSQLWISQGKKLLEQAGHQVVGLAVTDPASLIGRSFKGWSLTAEVAEALKGADTLLVDKDLGAGVTSTPLICVVRHTMPRLPIIRWSDGQESSPYMGYLGVSTLQKPSRKIESGFAEAFEKAANVQELILSGPMGIFDALNETNTPDEWAVMSKKQQLRQLPQIAGLAERDKVNSDHLGYPWGVGGRYVERTKQELGHCICDGLLTVEEVRPYLPALQILIAKLRIDREIDDRFRICAEFIGAGNLDELELVRGCY